MWVELSVVVLILDVLVSFNTGFYENGKLQMSRKKIAKFYIKWAFELDLIGVLCLLIALITTHDWIR